LSLLIIFHTGTKTLKQCKSVKVYICITFEFQVDTNELPVQKVTPSNEHMSREYFICMEMADRSVDSYFINPSDLLASGERGEGGGASLQS
jgi:hypothetical protein